MPVRRTLYVYDGDVSITYEPVSKYGNDPSIRIISDGTGIAVYGRHGIEKLTDMLISIRADMAVRKSGGSIAKEVAEHGT